ncbi:hypothetical protein GCM10017635_33030 [Paracoccus kondratievae]|uniref:Uncharacterized protein n=1 Tax=Paracoccus kondratievae TaxID=135740 RepID=A0AAD3P223_9RHOB|nr:hypothetical protein GCM10017635_33030 [Paracoccus kondratievae]
MTETKARAEAEALGAVAGAGVIAGCDPEAPGAPGGTTGAATQPASTSTIAATPCHAFIIRLPCLIITFRTTLAVPIAGSQAPGLPGHKYHAIVEKR